MKKTVPILFSFAFLCSMQLHSQISTFVKKYNTQETFPNSTSVIRKSAQNKKYLTTGGNFMLLAETNEQGDTVKTSKMIPYNGGIGGTIMDDIEGNLWFDARRFNAPPTFYVQYSMSKLDNNLNPLFSKIYSSPTGHLSLIASPLQDTTFIVQGLISQGGWNNPVDLALIKADKNGDTLWCKKYDDGGLLLVSSLSPIIPFTSNSFIISGATRAIDTGDVVLSKLDVNGNVLWAKAYGGNDNEGATIHYTTSNSIFAFGISTSFTGSNANGLLIKTDTVGNLIWAKSISCPNGFNYSDGEYEPSKGVLTITGMSNYNIPNWRFLAMQIDTNGVVINNKNYEFSPDDDYGLSFVKMNDGGYLFTLSEYNNSILNYDTKIFKTDSLLNSGCLPNTTAVFTTTDVTTLMHENTLSMVASPLYIDVIDTVTFGSGRGCAIQTECSGFVGVEDLEKQENILKIYPNPATSLITIEFEVAEAKNVSIEIKNVLGQTIKTFSNKAFTKGNNKIEIGISEFSNGLYFVNVISDNIIIETKKIIKE